MDGDMTLDVQYVADIASLIFQCKVDMKRLSFYCLS